MATKKKRSTGVKRKTQGAATRSPKAGRPPAAKASKRSPVRRRQRSATAAVSKGTTLLQTDAGTEVVWGANQRRPTKR
jgi:hypothetical protein